VSAPGQARRSPAEKAGQAQFRAIGCHGGGGFVGWGHGLVFSVCNFWFSVAVYANKMKLRKISEKANDFSPD
jgi:hypothetical protein